MGKHKYLSKLEALLDRIIKWKHIGPACHEDEWNDMEKALEEVDELIRLCTANSQYEVPKYRLRNCNNWWKTYKSKDNFPA